MSDITEKKDRLRAEALKNGIPSPEVERWLQLIRPFAALTGGDGPVAARYGGHPIVPVSGPRPEMWQYFVASIDCAAVPGEVTDLPLPSDGRLLFFADPDICNMPSGEVVYVPAGTAVAERSAEDYDDDWPLPCIDLRLKRGFSLPDGDLADIGFPHSELLDELWCDIDEGAEGIFELGGYPRIWNNDPVEREPAEEDWVLLAEWSTADDVKSLDLGIVYWTIRRADLAEHRFDRVRVEVDMVG
ncbi:DUF1963 domain-containing protein [Streptomonospora litoralis]|uniref:DUF1963 domain-containing protein n=1 Tax=Streptomonospora litoralis TaxID=2498135 RepID=A0A4P6Q543_9ACTN|nr:DUF1963 domain-containing protein [Streptomonospora litoralis]QBI55400.1 hypothetical protein EKD16_18180 [Streptomonospora litoralis]